MKATTSAAAVAALASLSFASARVDISSIHRDTTAPIVPGAYIVEIDPKTVGISAFTGGKRSINPHHDLYESLHKRGVNWDVRKEYDDDELFVGASLDLKTEEDLIQVAQTEGVVNIRPVTILPRPIPVKKHILTGADDPELVNGPKDGGSVHFMTGVDKLHKAGYTGKGVKIGVLDSGFDYNHPNLGGGYGAGFKFQYGYDFVGNDYDGGNTPTPDEDPDDSCNGEGSGHGTHVAGSIGGNPGNNPYGFSGVAYEAIMGGYRVFGCTGGVSDDILVEAIMRAYHDGNDIITMSLGGPAGWTASVSSVVSSRVAKAGRIVTIAAGNDGSFGQFYAAGPSSGIEVISVASVDNTVIPVRNAISSDRTAPIPYYSLKPLPFNESLPVYAISKEIVPNDGCNPLPDSTPDLSGFMVLIRRGVCPFVQKLENVAAKGARVALIYNNGGSPNAFDGGVIPGALISTEDGAYLLGKFNAGTPPKITFPQDGPVEGIEAASGGLVSTFSTYGPTFDAWMKPSVAAPGGGIVSTMPLEQGGWGIMSGTSMATPYVAGVSALLLEAKGRSKATARAARDLLQTTAQSIPFSKADGAPYQTVNQQGAGLINAYNAITYTTVVAPGQLLLNDTTHFKERQTFEVKNTGKKAQKYKLSHIPAGTAHTVPAGAVEPNLYPVPLTSEAATVSISESSFSLRPGQSKQIRVSFAAPKIDASTIPSYSGWVEVASDSGEVLAVTYMGIASELKKAVVFDNSPEFFGIQTPAVLGPNSEPVTNEATFNFNGTDYPAVLFRLVFGTRALVFDLVKEDLTLPNTINKRGWLSDFLKGWWGDFKDFLTTWWGGKPPGSYGQVPIVGPLTQYDWNPRHVASEEAGEGYSVFSLQNNTFANNTAIPNGRYKILARALKVSGDPRKQEDYESWLSPVLVFAKP